MRTAPDETDAEEIERLNAEPWMLDLLALNPRYVYWGPHEDYMWKEGSGWDSRVILSAWSEMWALDELNECANFYFSVDRAAKKCEPCDGSGHNPATKRIADDFYNHSSHSGNGWNDAITQDEVAALWEQGRLKFDFKDGLPSAERVNQWQRGRGIGHDAINRWILVETRAKRLGVFGQCAVCEGHGDVFTAPAAAVSLTLWMLHPRKGCSRGVEIARIEQQELPAVFAWLRAASQRNTDRFGKIPTMGEPGRQREDPVAPTVTEDGDA